MKNIIFLFLFFFQLGINAQTDCVPSGVDIKGDVECSTDTIAKGGNVNFEFFTEFNKQVTLTLYSKDGKLISTTAIEVFSDRGLAIATRSFEPATYFMCLKLKTKTLIKRVTITP